MNDRDRKDPLNPSPPQPASLAANEQKSAPDEPQQETEPTAQEPSLASMISIRRPSARPAEPTSEVVRAHARGLLEALLFISAEPLSVGDLVKLGQLERPLVRELMEELRAFYRSRGIQLDEVAGGWLFRTNPAYGPFVRDMTAQKPVKLTRAQIETLAIVAYRQPITRPEIDEVRGVDSGPMLKVLLERDLLRILGKREEPGRPIIYGTSSHFLSFFALNSLKDLPTLREFGELTEESKRLYEQTLGEAAPEELAESDAPLEGTAQT